MIHRQRRKLVLVLALAIAIFCLVSNVLVIAQEKNSTPIFEDVTLIPNFAPDPMTIRGLSGGFVPAQETTGRAETVTGPCIGFIDEQPDHRLVLTTFFDYLSIQVKSSEDTSLVIRGPGGTWCNDDYEGKNPGIVGQWLSGNYEIWVGSYQRHKYAPYIIRISQHQ
jgi:hypothetical protein